MRLSLSLFKTLQNQATYNAMHILLNEIIKSLLIHFFFSDLGKFLNQLELLDEQNKEKKHASCAFISQSNHGCVTTFPQQSMYIYYIFKPLNVLSNFYVVCRANQYLI